MITPSTKAIKQLNNRLRASVSITTLVISSVMLLSSAALADPSIIYNGNVTPAPTSGVTNWSWAPVQVLIVGDGGAGTLDIRGGATASGRSDSSMFIGHHSGSGSVVVDGQGSSLTTNRSLIVGQDSNSSGSLIVSNGGRVSALADNNVFASAMTIGSSGNGRVLVTGSGSELYSDNVIIVGANNTGELTIADGGQVIGYQLYLGNNKIGTGTVTIAGGGSAWTGQYGVWVGQFGKGTLNLSDGGSINDTTLQIAYDAGTTGTVNIGGAYGGLAAAAGNINVDKIVFNRNGGGSSGTLNFNTTDGLTVGAAISGEGTINQLAGTTVFTGDDSGFSGTTNVDGGALLLGNNAPIGGVVNVGAAGAFGGDGEVKGTSSFANGSALYGQTGQKLTFDNGLVLPSDNQIDVVLTGGPSSDALFDVKGDLSVNGQLNIADGSAMDVGVYRIFDYTGTLSGNLSVGTVSEGDQSNYEIQTAIDHQINLISTFGRSFFFWDGTGPKNDGIIQGGDGTWDGVNHNWTGSDGQFNSPWYGNSFAVFGGEKSGTVTIDSGFVPSVNGMQFMRDGYVLQGGPLTLGGKDDPVIIVGDGDTDDASKTATINSVIQGADGLYKTGLGNLVLTGVNNYTGDTIVAHGTLTLGDGGSIDSSSQIKLDGNRYGDGTLVVDKSGPFRLSNQISGTGDVHKKGTGIATFAADNSFQGGLTVESGTAKAGFADHSFGSGILSVEKDGTADLGNFNTTTGGLSGSGKVALGTGTLTLDQTVNTTFSGTLDGTGGLTKNGEGNLTLSGTSSYSGATEVNAGALTQGTAGAFSGVSAYSVGNSGQVFLGGFATSMASLSNGGLIQFGGSGGTSLNVAGNYTGNNGTLLINSVLGGDASKSDLLKVGGDTSGTTNIRVNNQGGLGEQTVNGIEVVDVSGRSDGTFSLLGNYVTKDGKQAVVGGAYAYTLQEGTGTGQQDGNWYLTSHIDGDDPNTPRYSAGAPVYEGYVQNMLTLNKLPTLQQRVGNRYFAGASLRGTEDDERANVANVSPQGVWARVEGAHNRLEPSTSTARMKQDINTLQMQAGVDGQFYEGDNGRLIAGLTGQYGHAKGDISSLYGDGSIGTDAWSLGATATWYGNDGFYLDTQGQVTWFNNDLDSWTANQGLANGRKATGYALSAEAGKRLAIGGNWSLTPQAQLAWSSIHADAFRDVWDARISVDDGSSLLGRLGLAAEYATQWKDESGRTTNANVYGIANLYQEFLGGTTVNLAGVDFDTDNDRTWAGVGAGGTYAWADNKYALYGEGSINTGLNHFAQSYSFKANLGFKANW